MGANTVVTIFIKYILFSSVMLVFAGLSSKPNWFVSILVSAANLFTAAVKKVLTQKSVLTLKETYKV